MDALRRARLYFDTVRHLRLGQVVGRIAFHAVRPRPDTSPPPRLRECRGHWVAAAERRPSLVGPSRFRFLNVEGSPHTDGWDSPSMARLWRYNLHYFDDLNAADWPERSDWHRDLIEQWMSHNPPGRGTGWEPYPTSVRIVNWIKWALAGSPVPPAALASLAVQARWLSRRLERHLLGNHLLVNATALVFAGTFFEGPEAARWLRTGRAILDEQVGEQVLADGGHFELSPMYHAIVLESLLDLVNLKRAYPGVLSGRQRELDAAASRMQAWLEIMCHPDGEIAFFNDAAFEVAAPPAALRDYARCLGIAAAAGAPGEMTLLRDSGYVRIRKGPAVVLLDVARIGPDHQPGHAHADTLSFELSLNGHRVLVNTGTSVYGAGAERLRQRGTAAHNTVVVAGENSSEVWSDFRMARRARPVGFDFHDGQTAVVTCGHDGYRRLKARPTHSRTWSMDQTSLRIADTVAGGDYPSEARFHLHPDVAAEAVREGTSGLLRIGGSAVARWRVEEGAARLEPATWHPQFGVAHRSRCLAVTLQGGRSTITFRWDGG